jgi:hypothetical protein
MPFGLAARLAAVTLRHCMNEDMASPLPYTDTKPVGAADFYFAFNATFRFIERKLGKEGLRRYWRDLGTRYYAPVTARWQKGGLTAVADYWRAFLKAEPGAEVEIEQAKDEVVLQVKTCPIIKHLRDNQRAIMPDFCEHCYHVSEAMAAPAGLCVRVQGGNGRCTQRFSTQKLLPQDFNTITRCA